MSLTRMLSLAAIVLIVNQSLFADYRITQKTTTEDVTSEITIYAKGVRVRREQKMIVEGDADVSAMMGDFMPSLSLITQCDLKQDVTLNDKKKSYFINYYDWSSLPPDQLRRRPNQKVVIKGTSTVSSVATDSGKRQQMFGLTARWMKSVMTIETSADSCEGKSSLRMEQEGWFVDLSLSAESCKIPKISDKDDGGCRPKLIIKSMQSPGFFLEGTTRSFEDSKLSGTTNLKTTALSKETLDQALFEIPKAYNEVDSFSELMQRGNGISDMTAVTQIGDGEGKPGKSSGMKTIAIDFFSGNTSNVNETELRNYISDKLSSAGFSGFPVNSQADLLTGNFVNVIGVQLKKVKESGASKIGGLFGKVTGNEDASKMGTSEAEITITIFGKDGKTAVATATTTKKVSGKGNDAVKAAIDEIIGALLTKIK